MAHNILLKGFFGHNNLGDDLLLCEALRKIPAKYDIYYDASPDIIENLSLFKSIRNFRIISGRKEALSRCYDMLLYAGGGLFPFRTYTFKNLFFWFIETATCRKRIFNGNGVTPKPNSPAFSLLLKSLSWCSVRDDVSLAFCKEHRKQAVNCGDLYFGNSKHYTSHPVNQKKCIVSIAYPFHKKDIIRPEVKQRYELLVDNLAHAIQAIKSKGYTVEYLPFFIGRDEPMISDIQKKLNSSDKVLQRGIDFTLDTVDELFGRFNLALSMRFHSVLLAVKNAVPVVPISYDYKSEELLKEAGLVEYSTRYGIAADRCFGIEKDLDMSQLLNSIDRVISNQAEIMEKQKTFYTKKHKQVLENYRNIFGEDFEQ